MPTFRHPLLHSPKPQAAGTTSIRRSRNHVDTAAGAVEFHDAVNQSEQREILSLPDPAARVKSVADLPDNDVAGNHAFARISLDAAPLTGGISAIAAGTLTFLMCHEERGARE